MTIRPSHVLISWSITAACAAGFSPLACAVKKTATASEAAEVIQAMGDPMSPVNPFNGGTDATTLPNDARIAVFTYSRDQIYRIMTAPLKTTTIELATGERLITDPALGDSVRWSDDTDGANHVFIKPNKPGLVNTLHISTNLREYDITLVSSPMGGFFYQLVRFNYPRSLMAKVQAREDSRGAAGPGHDGEVGAVTRGGADSGPIGVPPDQLNFDYTVSGSASFKPLTVFDDGKFTWIRMPDNAPYAVPAVKEDGDWVSPNSITRGQYLVVQRLADELELVAGKEKVTITRGRRRFLGVF